MRRHRRAHCSASTEAAARIESLLVSVDHGRFAVVPLMNSIDETARRWKNIATSCVSLSSRTISSRFAAGFPVVVSTENRLSAFLWHLFAVPGTK